MSTMRQLGHRKQQEEAEPRGYWQTLVVDEYHAESTGRESALELERTVD